MNESKSVVLLKVLLIKMVIISEALSPIQEIVNGIGIRADLYQNLAGKAVEQASSSTVDSLFVVGAVGAFLALAALGVNYMLKRYGLLDENTPGDSSFYNEETDRYNFRNDSEEDNGYY